MIVQVKRRTNKADMKVAGFELAKEENLIASSRENL